MTYREISIFCDWMTEKPEFRGRLRIAGKEVKGEFTIAKAFAEIKGVGVNLANALCEIICKELKIDKKEKIGNLTDDQISKTEEIIANPTKYGIPKWMLNRKRDPVTGKYIHMIGPDLEFQIKQDKKTEMEMKSYKGVRHMFGLPVRGQRTKTMGRKGLTLGVIRRKKQPIKKKEKKGKKK